MLTQILMFSAITLAVLLLAGYIANALAGTYKMAAERIASSYTEKELRETDFLPAIPSWIRTARKID